MRVLRKEEVTGTCRFCGDTLVNGLCPAERERNEREFEALLREDNRNRLFDRTLEDEEGIDPEDASRIDEIHFVQVERNIERMGGMLTEEAMYGRPSADEIFLTAGPDE